MRITRIQDRYLHAFNPLESSGNARTIADDTKAAARQSLNCIKNKKKLNMAKNDFQYSRWNSYTLQCGMWLWNRDSKFTK